MQKQQKTPDGICRKCGGRAKESTGIVNFRYIDGRKPKLQDKHLTCQKCQDCGHSWTDEQTGRTVQY